MATGLARRKWRVLSDAVRRSDTLTTGAGERRADALIAALSPRCWQRISAGAGAHGLREYYWARIPSAVIFSAVVRPAPGPADVARGLRALRGRGPSLPGDDLGEQFEGTVGTFFVAGAEPVQEQPAQDGDHQGG